MRCRYAFICLTLFHLAEARAQSTFNIRERYGFLACVVTGVVPTDSCYYVSGIVVKNVSPYNTGALFAKLGLDGEPLFVKALTSTQKSYETWYNSLMATDDGKLATVGYTIDSTIKTILIKYDLLGDTVFTKEYFNPYYPTATFIKPWGGAQKMHDGGVVIANHIQSLTGDPDYHVIRTDSLGNVLWAKTHGSNKFEVAKSVKTQTDGDILVGGIRTNQNTNAEDYVFQCQLFQFDTLGNQEWAWTSPVSDGLRDAANDMLVLDDGSIIVASGIGHEQINSSVNEVYFDRYIFKLNPLHQVVWELTFTDPILTSASRTTNLVNLSDGTGYILAGMVYNPPQFPPYDEAIKGWIAKISSDGDSIWTRRYNYLDDEPIGQTIYDMKETPDGGLILCGQSYDYGENATYPQQGWLLKLDGHGCLVPGCHLSDATEEGQAMELGLSIYPNPTADYLNFYLASPRPLSKEGAVFRIVNGSGQVVKEFSGGGQGVTYIVPVWDWPSGAYWLQCSVEGEAIISKQFQIQK